MDTKTLIKMEEGAEFSQNFSRSGTIFSEFLLKWLKLAMIVQYSLHLCYSTQKFLDLQKIGMPDPVMSN